MKKYVAKKNYSDDIIKGHTYALIIQEEVYAIVGTRYVINIEDLHNWFRPKFNYGK